MLKSQTLINFFPPLYSGIRLFNDEGKTTDATEASALVHELGSVDIYSNSWGPGNWGIEIEGPGPLTTAALKHGVEKVQFNTIIYFMYFFNMICVLL